jgi:DNA adenine methylase
MNKKERTLKVPTSPITYYGGKKLLVSRLLQLIPKHTTYVEPFFGGGALFFAKPKSEVEIINDLNRQVINFYEVSKTKFSELQALIQKSLHSRALMRDAYIMYQNPHLFTDVERAWAFYMLTNQGYVGKIGSSWGYGVIDNKREHSLQTKRDNFTEDIAKRLEHTQIECFDAVRLIELRDRPATFFYCDPPYAGANQGHYEGYTQAHFEDLLTALAKVKGLFLLSSYPNAALDTFVKEQGWHQIVLDMPCHASSKRKRKLEVLTANYPISLAD